MSDIIFEKSYEVYTYEIDTSGKLGVTGMMNFLQDIASTHASVLHFGKEDLEKNQRFWVLSRIYCKFDILPGWNERVVVKTWPRGIDKLFAIRDFEISDQKGNRIGGATSCWIMVNLQTRRPVRPDDMLAHLDGKLPALKSLDRIPEKLEAPGDGAYMSPLNQVKYSDLDINMHVNNVKYLQWTLDSYPLGFRKNNSVRSVEVNYLSETLPGDEVVISTRENGKFFLHSVIIKNSEKEACRLRIEWKLVMTLKFIKFTY